MKNGVEKIILQCSEKNPNFIGSWKIHPLSICDDLISYFEKNKDKQKVGVTGSGRNLETKDSIDIKIHPKDINLENNEVFKQYFHELFSCYHEYVKDWPFLKTFAGNLQIGSFNLQRYETGQHYRAILCERSSLESLHRVFAWMTYLNDVETIAGGSTLFSHYGLDVQPRQGLTLIWPSDWTHAHKGNVLKVGRKYIITGWMHLPDKA